MRKGWEIKKLGDVCDTGAGGTPLKSHKDYYENGDIPWLLSGEVSQGEIYNSRNYITKKGLKNSSAKLFPINTVLVAMYGATAGQVGILKFEACTNQAVCGILPNEKFIPKYIYYCFLSKKKELIAQAVGGAQPNISQIKIKNTKLPVISISEQQEIVSILDEAFESIERAKSNAEQNLKNAKELFDSYLLNIFENKGENWQEKRLGEICILTRGHNPPKSKFISEPKEGYVRFYQIRDGWADDYAVYVPDTTQLHKVNPSDILMVAYRHIGKVFRGVSGAFNVALCKISNKNDKILNNDYLFYLIPTDIVKGELMKRSERSLIPSMSIEHLKEIIIPLPPILEQERIVNKLNNLITETKKLESIYQQKLNDLEELKKSILQKAFNGELKTSKISA